MRTPTATHRIQGLLCALALGLSLAALGCPSAQHPHGDAASPAAASATGSANVAADREAVLEAHAALVSAMENADTEAFAAMLAPRDDLLLFHPRSENRFDGVEEIRDNVEVMFGGYEEAEWTDFHPVVTVDGNVGWLTSQVMISSLGFETPFVGRGTEVWVRLDGNWKLVHAHWSQVPQAKF